MPQRIVQGKGPKADPFKSVWISQDLLGVCSDVNFLHHQHEEWRNLQGEVDNRQQRSFTCLLSRKQHAAL